MGGLSLKMREECKLGKVLDLQNSKQLEEAGRNLW
jgi:hypothetical protein